MEVIVLNNLLTEDAVKILNKEIEHRKVVVRHQILEEIKAARAQGDAIESPVYKAAKKERGINESRIRYLEKMIRNADIISDTPADAITNDEVGLGKTVSIKFIEENELEDFTIVTTVETDLRSNKISIDSPLGKAIFRHRVGDMLYIDSPSGTYPVVIENISMK